MALGLVLWVCWICFMPFDRSAALTATKGIGYRYKDDMQNMGDDGEDEVLTFLNFDPSDWQALNNQPTGPVYTRYNKPLVAQWPGSVPSRENQPNTPSAPEVERLINGAARNWDQDDPEQQLLFPLNPNYQLSDPAKPQPGPVQPPSASLGVASTNGVPASPAGGSILSSPAGYDEPAPSSTSQVESPSSDTWQPEPVSSGYGVVDYPNQGLNSGSSGDGSSRTPHLVYEDVFQYPPENTGPSSNTAGGYSQDNYMSKGSSTASTPEGPSKPTNERAQPVYPSGVGSPSSGGESHNFEQTDDQTHDENPSSLPVQVTQRVSEPILPPPPPPPPPPSYIIQSRNGYQRARYLLTKSRYLPEFLPPMPVSSKGVRGQPAGPARNPQRTKW